MIRIHSISLSRVVCGVVVSVCLSLAVGGCSGPTGPNAEPRVKPQTARGDLDIQCDRPPSATTLYSMADILATQGKDAQCEFVLRRCIQQYPQFKPAYSSLGELQMRQGRTREAIRTLTQALEAGPRDAVVLNNLGVCLLVCKEYEKALQYFTEAAGIVPEREKYRANMATCLGLLGRDDESLNLLQQILPDDEARHNAEILRKARAEETRPRVGDHT